MSDWRYDEDYVPSDDGDSPRLMWLVVLIALCILAWALKPLWVAEFKRYVAIYRHTPEPAHLIVDDETAKGIRQICGNPQNSSGSVGLVILDSAHSYAGQANIYCRAINDVLQGGK